VGIEEGGKKGMTGEWRRGQKREKGGWAEVEGE